MEKIKIAICGYGNLGKGVESEINKSEDMEFTAIFTRRNPKDLNTKSDVPVLSIEELKNYTDKIDVMIMCGGSATDLPKQVKEVNKLYNTVDSFDTHAKIPEYFKEVNESALNSNKVSIISVGWDPGMFSVMRTYANSILRNGKTYTFWGKGVSQGHSDAIRRIEGVKNAIQYTIPVEEALNRVRNGENPELTTREKHIRECFVVAGENADKERIEHEIKTMPNYFDEYDTTVNFISMEELQKNHSKLPHGGRVIGVGETSEGVNQVVEFSLNLDSNPEFTASTLIAYGRATYRMWKEGQKGSRNFADVPLKYLSTMEYEDIIKKIL